MCFTLLSNSSVNSILDKLSTDGCVVFYPRYHHHFPILKAKVSGNTFIGIYYKIEHEEDIVTFKFDSAHTYRNGVYFKKDNHFQSYCVNLTEYFVGNQLTEIQKVIQKSIESKSIQKICKNIFEKFT